MSKRDFESKKGQNLWELYMIDERREGKKNKFYKDILLMILKKYIYLIILEVTTSLKIYFFLYASKFYICCSIQRNSYSRY